MTYTHPDGFLVVPLTSTGPGVLVLHAWWGLNNTIKAFCSQLAESGFVAFAPDLYHGQVADTIADAETLASAVNTNHLQAEAEIAEAALFLDTYVGQAERGLTVIGFSLGAYYSLHLSDAAPELIRSVVIFYGTGGDFFGTRADDFRKSRAKYLGHFAESDQFEPPSNCRQLAASLTTRGTSSGFLSLL